MQALFRFLVTFLRLLLAPAKKRPLPTRRDELVIEYRPRLDGAPDPGEIVWTWVAYEDDPSQGKDRPVLLIGRRNGRLVGVALTSKPDRRHRVEVGRGAWDREGRVSWAKTDRLIEVDAARVRREGAVLDRERFDRVTRAITAPIDA